MLNLNLINTRLGQYAAAWVASFLLVMLGGLAAALVRVPLITALNVLLATTLVFIAASFALFAALTLVSRQNGLTKIVLLVLGFVLLFPLLWAPMLGAVASAFFGQASVEYSTVYAEFRIIVGRAIFAVMSLFTRNPYVEAGLQALQVLATIVGFISSLAQLWQMLMRYQKRAATQG